MLSDKKTSYQNLITSIFSLSRVDEITEHLTIDGVLDFMKCSKCVFTHV